MKNDQEPRSGCQMYKGQLPWNLFWNLMWAVVARSHRVNRNFFPFVLSNYPFRLVRFFQIIYLPED